LIDIDNFKQVNDRWGHAVGDDVLVKTADIFQSMIRNQDLVGRWGGEEFLMIVPGACIAEAMAEREFVVRSPIQDTAMERNLLASPSALGLPVQRNLIRSIKS